MSRPRRKHPMSVALASRLLDAIRQCRDASDVFHALRQRISDARDEDDSRDLAKAIRNARRVARRLLGELADAEALVRIDWQGPRRSDGPPFDAATATGMYDHD